MLLSQKTKTETERRTEELAPWETRPRRINFWWLVLILLVDLLLWAGIIYACRWFLHSRIIMK
jgi:hypothetical protein